MVRFERLYWSKSRSPTEPGYYADGRFGVRIDIVIMEEAKRPNNFGAKVARKDIFGFEHVTLVSPPRNFVCNNPWGWSITVPHPKDACPARLTHTSRMGIVECLSCRDVRKSFVVAQKWPTGACLVEWRKLAPLMCLRAFGIIHVTRKGCLSNVFLGQATDARMDWER